MAAPADAGATVDDAAGAADAETARPQTESAAGLVEPARVHIAPDAPLPVGEGSLTRRRRHACFGVSAPKRPSKGQRRKGQYQMQVLRQSRKSLADIVASIVIDDGAGLEAAEHALQPAQGPPPPTQAPLLARAKSNSSMVMPRTPTKAIEVQRTDIVFSKPAPAELVAPPLDSGEHIKRVASRRMSRRESRLLDLEREQVLKLQASKSEGVRFSQSVTVDTGRLPDEQYFVYRAPNPGAQGRMEAEAKRTIKELQDEYNTQREALMRRCLVRYTQLHFGDILGIVGTFGPVYAAVWTMPLNRGSMDIAVRRFAAVPDDLRDQLADGIALHYQLRHPALVRTIGMTTKADSPKDLHVLMERCDGGNLRDFLRTPDGRDLSIGRLHGFIAEALGAMVYLHTQCIVHRDLSARNMLLSADRQHIKITDVGYSALVNADKSYYHGSASCPFGTDLSRERHQPYRFLAPESLQWHVFKTKSDVWSVAVTAWEIYSHAAVPYVSAANADAVLLHIRRGQFLERPVSLPANIFRVFQSCWVIRSDHRPTMEAVYAAFADAALNKAGAPAPP